MAPGNEKPRRIVRTISGRSTDGTDDIFIDERGEQWVRAERDSGTGTAGGPRVATIYKGWILP